MSRLTAFPPDFNPKIPSPEDTPVWRFLPYYSRKFLLKEQINLDFSKQENVQRFDEALTKAIHKDVDAAKTNFSCFVERLQPVSKAFESLYKVNTFFKGFGEFVDLCLSTNFHYTTFQQYVESLNEWMQYYTHVLVKGYKYFPTPMTWPQPEARTELLAPIRHPDNLTNPIDIDTLANPNLNHARIAMKNYQMALELYSAMQTQYLAPQFKRLAIWLSGSPEVLMPIRREFDQTQARLESEILQRQRTDNKAMQGLKYRFASLENATVEPDFKQDVYKSIEAVKAALSTHYEVVNMENEVMLDVVLKVYDHALEVLKPFKELACSGYALGPNIGPNAYREREDAKAAVERWMIELEEEKKRLLNARKLPNYLQDLPKLYAHIAQFSFINCGDYHDY